MSGAVDTNKWSNIHIRAEIIENANVKSPDGMKIYDAVGYAISVWTGFIKSLIEVVWCHQK